MLLYEETAFFDVCSPSIVNPFLGITEQKQPATNQILGQLIKVVEK